MEEYMAASNEYNRERDDLFCAFCGKPCKSLNSLNNHEYRCPSNPNRRNYNVLGEYSHNNFRGATKETSDVVARWARSLKAAYDNGYEGAHKGTKRKYNYVWKQHNDEEIQKWINDIQNIQVDISDLQGIKVHKENYAIITHKIKDREFDTSYKFYFVHNIIMERLIGCQLPKGSTVHHIDLNRLNNAPTNLILFRTSTEHKRFHRSDYAWIDYDRNTHTFSCEVKR